MPVTTFSWIDYFLFALMLVSSALVGVYYGFVKKQDTARDYIHGGKQMTLWPIAMSVVSSTLSGFTLLSAPADIYRYGITFGVIVLVNVPVALSSYFIFLPVFYKLQVTSVYEYFNIRFNNKVRVFASFMYAIGMLLFLPVVIYTPALALEHVTFMNVHLITPIVCGVCIFYTTLGGLRAVVWTDTIQFGVMMGSLVIVAVVGTVHGGGLGSILENSYRRGQFNISFDLDFLRRDSFWGIIIGQSVQVTSYFCVSQGSVQKFLSLPSYPTIKITLIWSIIGIAIIQALSIFSGILMFNKYADCDPYQAHLIKTPDQILPLYVMEAVSFIPGLCGLFISGIFSAGLSTLSAIMNCLAATIYEDFISPFVSKDTSQKRISQYLKVIVVIIGISSTAMVYVVEKLGSLVELTVSIAGITSGPTLGLFTVGVLFPQVTAKGALAGGIVSICVMTWTISTSQWYRVKKMITYPILHMSTDGCNVTIIESINKTIIDATDATDTTDFEKPFVLYRVSFYWYALMGFTTVVIVALVVSYFTEQEKPLDRDCICPLAQRFIKKEDKRPPEYDEVVLEKLNKEKCDR